MGIKMVFVRLLLKKKFVGKKSILFLSPKALSFTIAMWQVCGFHQWDSQSAVN